MTGSPTVRLCGHDCINPIHDAVIDLIQQPHSMRLLVILAGWFDRPA